MVFRSAQPPYLNLSTPFQGTILGGLQDGLQIIIKGTVLSSGGSRFAVNFQTRDSENDIAFQFNPRFEKGGYVVCNTKQNGSWGSELKRIKMPFRKGKPFEICVLVQILHFKVMVNRSHFLQYSHRVPFHCVDTISIEGPLQLDSIEFQNATMPPMVHPNLTYALLPSSVDSPASWKSVQNSPPAVPDVGSDCCGLTCPLLPQPLSYFSTAIPGGLCPSKSVIVSGTVLPYAESFHINLSSGRDITFQLKPRFNENAMVSKIKINKSWRSKKHRLPFERGQNFLVRIVCESDCFKMAVNGQRVGRYDHSLKNLSAINKLEVAGDIQLTIMQA
ncbi:galectin-9B-like isoform X2 [Loxodonta africana]|uniref:galectin-9B-like isoform X2 n=1 Tax=Loxodonta africana TaxID=9785 RepID=UPI000C812EEA|nr:galectin-9B-like isoform X2 [Loxodonta africana]